jgi:UDP-N-acetylmuramyl tripeptide synthase
MLRLYYVGGLSTEDGATFTSDDSWVITTVSSPIIGKFNILVLTFTYDW